MAFYAATSKGLVRGATIEIEEVVGLRSIGELDEQERALMRAAAQTIIDALGGVAMIEPEQRSIGEALKGTNAVLDVADIERRELNTLERDIVIDAALSILLSVTE
jgi:hypothetical protein